MIEVGEYVRTKHGYIVKTTEKSNIFNLGYEEEYIDMEYEIYSLPFEEEIVNHSKNIIDLIEVGDYVNGCRVKQINCKLEYIDDDSDTGVSEVYDGLEIEGYPTWIYFEPEIKTILTKEQYEANCYKVEEE